MEAEAEVLKLASDHPNVVRFHGVFRREGTRDPPRAAVHRHVALRRWRPRQPAEERQQCVPPRRCHHALGRPAPPRSRARSLQGYPASRHQARKRLPHQVPQGCQDWRLRHRQGADGARRPRRHAGRHLSVHVPRAVPGETLHVRFGRGRSWVHRVRDGQRRRQSLRRPRMAPAPRQDRAQRLRALPSHFSRPFLAPPSMLAPDPADRPTAAQLLGHPPGVRRHCEALLSEAASAPGGVKTGGAAAAAADAVAAANATNAQNNRTTRSHANASVSLASNTASRVGVGSGFGFAGGSGPVSAIARVRSIRRGSVPSAAASSFLPTAGASEVLHVAWLLARSASRTRSDNARPRRGTPRGRRWRGRTMVVRDARIRVARERARADAEAEARSPGRDVARRRRRRRRCYETGGYCPHRRTKPRLRRIPRRNFAGCGV